MAERIITQVLIKHSLLLTYCPSESDDECAAFLRLNDDGTYDRKSAFVTSNENWFEMNNPTTVTVSVEVGDRLN